MTGTKEDYIKYRLERAEQTLKDAKILIQQESLNSAVNRLYYACYYAVHALLLKYEIKPKTHSGTKTIFYQTFIQTGIIKKEYSKLYSDLFDWRQEGDYADFIEFDKKTVDPLPEKVYSFINTIKSIIFSEV